LLHLLAQAAIFSSEIRSEKIAPAMNEKSFLEGKVRQSSLPVFHNASPALAAGPKRLLLAQGELANFYDGLQGIRYMAFIELRPGGIRGNHFHRVKKEHVYLISGEVLMVAQDGKEGTPVSIMLNEGDLVTIETGIAHALKPLRAGSAIEFSETSFDAADVHGFKLM
jgi:mannose-6-phosphate isomerase-like protein (cupin superfamily)